MKSILVGFDAFDPALFEKLSGAGRLPHLTSFMGKGGYAPFRVSNPPQSEVSWTSIATGLNPGSHGVFDFVHRNPQNYTLHVSLLPTQKGLGGVQFVRPYDAETIFDYAVDQGYPATSLWWPATFPARPGSPVATLPGLGTPDVLGRLGVGIFFFPQSDGEFRQDDYKTRVEQFTDLGSGRYRGKVGGPSYKKGADTRQVTVDVELEVSDSDRARLILGSQRIELRAGEWSPILEIKFKVKFGVSVHAITQALYHEVNGQPGLYLLPLQIHPLKPSWPYTAPRGLAKKAWVEGGPYLTLGWPQDTTGLDEGFIEDEHFLRLCESILAVRERIFLQHLRNYHEGVLGIVFDSLDRVQHMFWKHRPDVIEGWYEKLDALFGRILEAVHASGNQDARILVLSDHGFSAFDHKVHVNRRLIETGRLTPNDGEANLRNVNWQQTEAYALGLNSLYLNQSGREGEGMVEPNEVPALTDRLLKELETWDGPDGRRVFSHVWRRDNVFHGPLAEHGPDLILGFNSGYRASAETGLGSWGSQAIVPNKDHWGADHCIDPNLVPGVLFANFMELQSPSYEDIPEMVTGTSFDRGASSRPPEFSEEDEQVLEERLKDLGYL